MDKPNPVACRSAFKFSLETTTRERKKGQERK